MASRSAWGRIAAAGWLVVTIAGSATAATGAASVTPAATPPGGLVEVVFTVESTDPAEILVQESIQCAVEGPAEVAADCTTSASLAEVRLLPATREYVFRMQAPPVEGEYTITLTRANTLSAPDADVTATTGFQVVALVPDDELVAAIEPPALVPADTSGDDAARWLASSTMGTAALVGAIVVGRRGLGGLR